MICNKKIATTQEIAREYTTIHQEYKEHCCTLKEFKEIYEHKWINYDYCLDILSSNCICSEGNEGFCLMCDIIKNIKEAVQ